MSSNIKYRSDITDFNGSDYSIRIYTMVGLVETQMVTSGGEPVEINTLGEGDSEEGIKPKEWIITFLNSSNFQYLPLFTGTARSYQMRIYKGASLIGIGWVDPDNYSEEFISGTYPSKIHVTDGLGELKNIYFSKPDDPETFNKPVIWYISQALHQTGFLLNINIATDFIFRYWSGTQKNSRIFEYLNLDWRLFRIGENEYWSYMEILNYIIRSFEGLRVFQENGEWWIERAGVMKASQYDVDIYNWAGVFQSAVKKTSTMALTSNSVANPLRFSSDAELTIVPAWKRFKILQEYGVKDNLLKFYNLDGNFFLDEWKDSHDLLFWTRAKGIILARDDGRYPRIRRFCIADPPTYNYIQSDTFQIVLTDVITNLIIAWQSRVKLKLSFEYKLRCTNYQYKYAGDTPEELKLFAKVILQDSYGNYWGSSNNYQKDGEKIVKEYAWMDQDPSNPKVDSGFFIQIDPSVNEWNSFNILIDCPDTHYALYQTLEDPYLPDTWTFSLKLYQAYSSLEIGDLDSDGVEFKSVKLGFVQDFYEPVTSRTINVDVNEDNRIVPPDISVSVGETPAKWGYLFQEQYGQQYMDRHIFTDPHDRPVVDFGTKSAGIVGGLIDAVMASALQLKHALPVFKLRGTVRDNPDTMDYTTTLEDYDGRKYMPTGMTRFLGACEVQAEWIQIREPEQGDAGEFNWDFSNDFNIGT